MDCSCAFSMPRCLARSMVGSCAYHSYQRCPSALSSPPPQEPIQPPRKPLGYGVQRWSHCHSFHLYLCAVDASRILYSCMIESDRCTHRQVIVLRKEHTNSPLVMDAHALKPRSNSQPALAQQKQRPRPLRSVSFEPPPEERRASSPESTHLRDEIGIQEPPPSPPRRRTPSIEAVVIRENRSHVVLRGDNLSPNTSASASMSTPSMMSIPSQEPPKISIKQKIVSLEERACYHRLADKCTLRNTGYRSFQ